MRKSLLLLLLALLPACAHGPAPREPLDVQDTVRALLDGPSTDVGGKVRDYEARFSPLLQGFAAAPKQVDPDERIGIRLLSQPDALLTLLAAFDDDAEKDVRAAAVKVENDVGPLPSVRIILGFSRSPEPVFKVQTRGRTEAVLFNARSPSLAERPARNARYVRELTLLSLQNREPTQTLSPLADALYRQGMGYFAARRLVKDANETQLLDFDERTLSELRRRQALIAREALSAIDSARESAKGRFFDPQVRDPIVPRGAGAYLADRVYQELAIQLQSPEKPLKLSPDEFQRRARQALSRIAQ